MNDKLLLKLYALLCIELIVLLPMIAASTFNIADASESIQGNVVTIVWSTTSPTNASLYYGLYSAPTIDRDVLHNTNFLDNHSMSLSSLDPGERYSYEIVASTASGTEQNRVGAFTMPDSQPPSQPTGLKLQNVTEDMAWIVWDNVDQTQVEDFKTYLLFRNDINVKNTTYPRYKDEGLNGSNSYLYQVAMLDDTGNIGPISDGLVVTTQPPDTVPPAISNVIVAGLSNTSMMVSWNTNEEANSIVHYGIGNLDFVKEQRGSYRNHTVPLSNLQQDKSYRFVAGSCDRKNNCANASESSFIPGGDFTPPTLEVDIPELYNANRLPLFGTTEPLARVAFYLNNKEAPSRIVQAKIDGVFATEITLDVTQPENRIRIVAQDYAGNSVSREFVVKVDADMPVVELSEFPPLVTKRSLSINGSVSESVQLNVFVANEHDATLPPPSPASGLNIASVTSNSVRLEWERNNQSEEIDFYKIYRNTNFIGTSNTNGFTDCVNAGTEYTYQVSAVNDNCDEGPKSNSQSALTLDGDNCRSDRDSFQHECKSVEPTKTVTLNRGSFKQSISIEPGRNSLRLEFVDSANNIVYFYGDVIYDVKAPRIVWDNIDDLNPSYEQEVIVRGKVDENATIFVTVNNDSSYTTVTDMYGNFSVEIDLEKIDFEDILEERRSRNQITGRVVTGTDGRITGKVAGELTGRQVDGLVDDYVEEGEERLTDDHGDLERYNDIYYTEDGYRVGQIDGGNYYSYQDGFDAFETAQLQVTTESGRWKNHISITAVDMVGRESNPVEGYIEYAMCSLGNYWGITIGEVRPRIIIPRLLLRGLAQITFDYKLEWLGGSGSFEDERIPSVSPRISFRQVSNEEKAQWDVGWFRNPRVIRKPGTNNTEGYVVIQSRVLDRYFGNSRDYRRDLAEAIRDNATGNFTTSYEMEENISKHRQDDEFSKFGTEQCLVPGLGCVKLPLEMELRFSDPVYRAGNDDLLGTNSPARSTSVVQRQCWDLEVAIDKRVDPGIIPETFLEKSILFLNKTIMLIDKALVPLNKIKEYTLYACLGSWVILYVKAMEKRWSCEFSGTLKELLGQGFKMSVAEQGLCKAAYGQEGQGGEMLNDAKYNACMECTLKVKEYRDFTETMQYICDRIACPSAPSFLKYVKDAKRTRSQRSSAVISNVTVDPNQDDRHFTLGPLEHHSDCRNVELTFSEVASQYARWKKYRDEGELEEFSNPRKVDGTMADIMGPSEMVTCYDPHMPNSDCCVFEYMRTYDSVCGLMKGSLFDEMKESYCVAGTRSYSRDSTGADIAGVSYAEECEGPVRKVWESLAGFCERDPAEEIQLIDSNVQYATRGIDYFTIYNPQTVVEQDKENEGVLFGRQIDNPYEQSLVTAGGPAGAVYINGEGCPTSLRPHDDRGIFYRIMPLSEDQTGADDFEDDVDELKDVRYAVHRGVVLRDLDLLHGVDGSFTDPNDDSPVGSSMVFRPLARLPEDWFLEPADENIDPNKKISTDIVNEAGYQAFKADMSKCAGSGSYDREIDDKVTDEIQLFLEENMGLTREELIQEYSEDKDLRDSRNHITPDTFESMLDQRQEDLFEDGELVDITRLSNRERYNLRNTIATSYIERRIVSDSYAREVYKDIRNSMGLSNKDEIVDPTSSFLRSVQCLCLPGITGYLKLWRAVLTAVRACFQTILITGDGNPGICQAVLTYYVCDLIYDLIRCFTQKYTSGGERTIGYDSFPGNIIGTLTSAGRDVERTVASRYGNAAFYRALFAERQLMHAVCLWFFTGTFKFDFNALVEGEYGDVPVASQGLLAPCQRRFMSYNNANAGRTTWNYFIGVGLVAGARLNYQLKLKCSDGYDCDYGYGNEMCDCNGKPGGEKFRTVTLRNAPSSLDRYDVLEEVYDDLITDDVRYDTAILEYSYIDKDRDRITRNVTCDIRTVGGDPPAFCQMDVGQGIYRCSLNMGQEDYAILTQVIDPKPTGWKIGDQFQINAVVSQKIPENLDCWSADSCENTKFLAVELNTHDGRSFIKPDADGSYIPILVDGTLTYSLPSTPYQILEEDFTRTGQEVSDTSRLGCEYFDKNEFVSSCTGTFQSDDQYLKLRLDPGGTVAIDETNINNGQLLDVGKRNPCRVTLGTRTTCYFVIDGTHELKFRVRTQLNEDEGISLPSYVTMKPRVAWQYADDPQQRQQYETGLCGGESEVVWTGKVVIFDAVEEGGVYRRSDSVYVYNGEPQEKPFSIRIICDDPYEDETGRRDGRYVFNDIVNSVLVLGNDITDKTSIQIPKKNFQLQVETRDIMRTVTYQIIKGDTQTTYDLKPDGGTNRKKWVLDDTRKWQPDQTGNYTLRIFLVSTSSGETAYRDYTATVN